MLAVITLCVAGVGGMSRQQPSSPAPVEPPRFAARRLEAAGRHAEAAPLYEKAAAENPESTASALSLLDRAGWCYLTAGQYTEARRVFTVMIEKAPRFGNALDGLGIALFETGDLTRLKNLLRRRLSSDERKRAIKIVTAGIRAEEASLERSWGLGYLHMLFGGGRAAGMKPLERVLALQPEHEEARRRLALLLARCGLADESEAAWDEYLRRHPDTPDAFAERVRREGKRAPLAGLAVAEAGLERYPDSVPLYVAAGVLCAKLPDPEAADRLRSLLSAARNRKARMAALLMGGQLFRRLADRGSYAEADILRKSFPRAVRQTPQGREQAAHLALARGRVAESLPLYRDALKAANRDPLSTPERRNAIQTMEALLLVATGDREGASRALTRGRERIPSLDARSAPLPEIEALAYWLRWESSQKAAPSYRAGERVLLTIPWEKRPLELTEAARRAAVREIVRRYPDCYPAHHLLARSLAWTGEHQSAEAALQAAREACPLWWLPRWSLAGAYLQSKRFAEARRELEAARTLAPGLHERVEAILRALERRPSD